MNHPEKDGNIIVPDPNAIQHSPSGEGASTALTGFKARKLFDQEYNPILPEPEAPSNSLARLYHSFTKNDIEMKVYRDQYLKIADKQAEMMMERANHIINKAKVIHSKELEQLKEALSFHNADIISGLQQNAHEQIQEKLLEISNQYLKKVEQIAAFPPEIRAAMHEDAKAIWTHSRQKILKYALEMSAAEAK